MRLEIITQCMMHDGNYTIKLDCGRQKDKDKVSYRGAPLLITQCTNSHSQQFRYADVWIIQIAFKEYKYIMKFKNQQISTRVDITLISCVRPWTS